MTIVSFYCKNCELDQDRDANIGYYCGGGKKFIARCQKCKRELFRLIDEKKNDPYYFQSKNVIMNRQKFLKETLQPNQEGFRMYYKKEYEKMEKAKEEYEKKEKEEKRERDEFYRKMTDKGLAKKILGKEDEIKYDYNSKN